jgi:hypothetical protein
MQNLPMGHAMYVPQENPALIMNKPLPHNNLSLSPGAADLPGRITTNNEILNGWSTLYNG